MTRVWLSAGEPSGDLHAAALVPALREAIPDLHLAAMGGPHLAAAGARIAEPAERLGSRGLVEVFRDLPAHVAALRRVRTAIGARRYDLVILVDYPGFHLRVARAAHGAGIPVLYYIAPQLWAWGAWRTRAVRRSVSRMAVILPFEEAFFRGAGVPAAFVGHPLLDRARPSRLEARRALGLDARTPVLALLPGSRPHDVERHWAVFRATARRVLDELPGGHVLLACVDGQAYPGADDVVAASGPSSLVLAAADVALCKSGTVTLEAALAGTPLVVAYRHHPVTHAVAKRAVRVAHVGLVNLVAERPVAPEFLQRGASPERLVRALLPLFDREGRAATQQREGLARVCARLGTPGAARRVAAFARELVA